MSKNTAQLTATMMESTARPEADRNMQKPPRKAPRSARLVRKLVDILATSLPHPQEHAVGQARDPLARSGNRGHVHAEHVPAGRILDKGPPFLGNEERVAQRPADAHLSIDVQRVDPLCSRGFDTTSRAVSFPAYTEMENPQMTRMDRMMAKISIFLSLIGLTQGGRGLSDRPRRLGGTGLEPVTPSVSSGDNSRTDRIVP